MTFDINVGNLTGVDFFERGTPLRSVSDPDRVCLVQPAVAVSQDNISYIILRTMSYQITHRNGRKD